MASGPRNAGGTARTRAPLSCTIICYDEEEGIRAALESVKWCDEIVVVDSFSTDRTVEICREYTDRIFQREWPGFVEQKAFAIECDAVSRQQQAEGASLGSPRHLRGSYAWASRAAAPSFSTLRNRSLDANTRSTLGS